MPDDDLFLRHTHAVSARARAAATTRGSATTEAEHLLLALLAEPASPTARALEPAGLTHEALTAALDDEWIRSLADAGITVSDERLLRGTPSTADPGWGTSIKDARTRMHDPAVRARDSLEVSLAVAVLQADLGRLPRALAYGGFDRLDLIARLEAA